jgi:polyisoprenoid-binding protein YceI
VAGVLCLPEDGERNGNGDPRRIAGRAYLTRVRASFTLAALLFAGLACSAQAAPRRIRLGPPDSEVAFRAYGLGLLPIDANFTRFEGWLTYDPDDRRSCRVELSVQVASLVTSGPLLRRKLCGARQP